MKMGISPNQGQGEKKSKIDKIPLLELLLSMWDRIGQDQRKKPQRPHIKEISLSKLLLVHHSHKSRLTAESRRTVRKCSYSPRSRAISAGGPIGAGFRHGKACQWTSDPSNIQAFFFRGLTRQFGFCLISSGRLQKMENVSKETDECRKDKVAKLRAFRQFCRQHGRSRIEKHPQRENFVPGTISLQQPPQRLLPDEIQ